MVESFVALPLSFTDLRNNSFMFTVDTFGILFGWLDVFEENFWIYFEDKNFTLIERLVFGSHECEWTSSVLI
jgi:hypothetical protein